MNINVSTCRPSSAAECKYLPRFKAALCFCFFILVITYVPALAQQCSPVSLFSCPAIVKDLPLAINFNGSEGGLLDKNGATTGFTMVDKPSAPMVPPTLPKIAGYEPSKLHISAGKLIITTTPGISHLNPAQSSGTNSQVNALGVGFVAPLKLSIQTTLAQPNAGTGKSEQAGMWFGKDEDNYVKLVVLSAGGGNSKIEMRKEIAAISSSADSKSSPAITVSSSEVHLKLVVNRVANTIEGFYKISGATEISIGTLAIPKSLTTGKTLADNLTQNISFAGIFATNRGATTPLTFSFDNFTIEGVPIPKGILFTQSSQNTEVPQGSSKSLQEYISTSDNTIVNSTLNAKDDTGNVPAWLSVNGNLLNGISYTTGSEISLSFDARGLSIGSYNSVITASSPGYAKAVLDIMLTVTMGPSGTLTTLKVNFQDAVTIPPSGWIRDFGQPFGPRTSPYQGSGALYGWKNISDKTPLDLTQNVRLRKSPPDILLATLVHMQGNHIKNFMGTPAEGIWEAQVANGYYDVTVSVGDGAHIDSRHYVNIEGVNAIADFIPSAAARFKTATIPVSVTDGYLTVDAKGGTNTKLNWITIQPTTSPRPYVVSVNPENGSANINENASVSTSILNLPNGGINNETLTDSNVILREAGTGVIVPSHVNGTGGGDAITLVPAAPLKLGTGYSFSITAGVKDLPGASFIPYTSTFTTKSTPTPVSIFARFNKIGLPAATGRHSSLAIGPDGKLYALGIDGMIKRFSINADGTLAAFDSLFSLQDAYGPRKNRFAIGFAFDPSATAAHLVVWITHSTFVSLNGPDWDGKLTRLSGTNLDTVQDVVINLPRSVKDHLTNSIAFGPDGALYFAQGSNSAMGRADSTWGMREEHLLSGAVLRLDRSLLATLPLDVKTAEGGGTYNPYLPGSPLTIYASGIRNAFDLLWHSNGQLYVPANGSAAGGNTPASVNGILRPDSTMYSGPLVPALAKVQQTQKDFLFRVQQGGFYGHPNPLRGEYVLNGGNPTAATDPAEVEAYPVGTLPDANWKGYSFDFQNNKSPDGVIEYKSNTFNGALKGKILVVRYSQHDDIITLTAGGPNNDIISSAEGTSIPGFSGFVDPLDLVEDVKTGNIYVSEFGGEGSIVLLKPVQ